MQKPWVFVRLEGDRLYYGCFDRYDKAADGSIESITLLGVQRYCYDEIDKCLSDGRLPLSRFQGPLRIYVAQISDIHTVPKNHFQAIEARYAKMMIRTLARDLLNAFAGLQRVSFHDIYVGHGGGTELTKFRYGQAIRYLELQGFIQVTPTTLHASPTMAPTDTAVVDFPRRVAARAG